MTSAAIASLVAWVSVSAKMIPCRVAHSSQVCGSTLYRKKVSRFGLRLGLLGLVDGLTQRKPGAVQAIHSRNYWSQNMQRALLARHQQRHVVAGANAECIRMFS